MPSLEYQRQIIAYHGCSQSVADIALRGGPLHESLNDYDWLGRGIYFWEHGPKRALEWAQAAARRKGSRFGKPSVVGALIQLGHCFDLLDVRFTTYLKSLVPAFRESFVDTGTLMPVNDIYFHRLDCAFLNWAIPIVETDMGMRFHTVRSVFVEGAPVYPTGHFFERSHIQIAVRDPSAIIGFFAPAVLDPS